MSDCSETGLKKLLLQIQQEVDQLHMEGISNIKQLLFLESW